MADPTTAWAQDVVSGRIIAGDLVRYAAERHLRDLKDGPKRGLHWRPELAQEAIDFFPAMFTITAGAMEGQPFHLLPWHLFTVGSLFGWRLDSGLCRFRTAWLETGKGQAKSPLMAGLGLYKMAFCGIRRAEVFAIAGNKQQANVLFKDAVGMCRAQIPDEEEGDNLEVRGTVIIRGTGEMAWKIEHPDTGSSFTALADSDSISGPRPVMVAADEIHEFKTADALELWRAAIMKMPGDPLMCLGTNTPAADQLVGTEYSETYQNVLRGIIHDDTRFAFIARVDPKDDPFADEGCWPKALPALNITFPAENLRAEVSVARSLASKRNWLLRLFFGVPVGSSEYWIDEDLWEATLSPVNADEMRGNPCWLGIDPSQRNDLTALAAVWRLPDSTYRAKVFYWKPKATLATAEAEDKAPYLEWASAGILNAVPGQTIRMGFIATSVRELVARHDVKAMAFDLAHFQDFREEAEIAGFPVWEYKGPSERPGSGLMLIRHAQGARGLFSDRQLWMPRSVQALEDQIADGSIKIDNSPITRWCSGNSMLNSDGQGNRWFDKKRSRGRIDGMVAIAMALGAATDTTTTPSAGPAGFLAAPLVL